MASSINVANVLTSISTVSEDSFGTLSNPLQSHYKGHITSKVFLKLFFLVITKLSNTGNSCRFNGTGFSGNMFWLMPLSGISFLK